MLPSNGKNNASQGGEWVEAHRRNSNFCDRKDTRKERKLNICNVLIKSSLLYGSETWRLTENNKRRVEATEMDALRRSSRISRKERIINVTIRQQIGLEETIIKKFNKTSLHDTAMFRKWQKEDYPK